MMFEFHISTLILMGLACFIAGVIFAAPSRHG